MNRLVPPYNLIREGLCQGRVIPFLGSGASLCGRDPQQQPWSVDDAACLPSASELASHLVKRTSFPQGETPDLTKVAQYYHVVAGRQGLQQELHQVFDRRCSPSSLHTFLADIPSPLLIVTTNYDDLVERAFDSKGRRYDLVIHTTDPTSGDRLLWWSQGGAEPCEVLPNRLDIDLRTVTVIYKMHGGVDRQRPERDQYVITEDDYIDFLARMTRNKAIPAIFAEPFQTRHFLFLGYSLRDWNLRVVLNRIDRDLRRPRDIKSWAIQHQPSPLEQRFWQERGVEIYAMPIEEFVHELKSC